MDPSEWGVMKDSLRVIAQEHFEWRARNFGILGPLSAHQPYLGFVEEIGEYAHAQLKLEQGIRGNEAELTEEKKDAIGDALVFLIDIMNYCAVDIGIVIEFTGLADLRVVLPEEKKEPMNRNRARAKLITELLEAGMMIGDQLLTEMGRDKMQTYHAISKAFDRLYKLAALDGWNALHVLDEVWRDVKQRDWKANPASGTV